MESESENGIFPFILLPQWQLRVNIQKPYTQVDYNTGNQLRII